jgi:hypothetical protein
MLNNMSKNYDLQNLINIVKEKDAEVEISFILKKDNMKITIICSPKETSNV